MKKFLKDMFSTSSEVSSKRVAGFIGWVIYCLIFICSISFSIEITDQQVSLATTLAYASAVLISGGAIENIVRGKQK